MKNRGLELENELINHINNKYFNDLNENIKKFLLIIYENKIDKSEPFLVKKFYNNYKPDIVITHNKIKKFVSIKSGKSCSIHQEHIYSFINFLNDINCPSNIIENLKLFHFNDGSINGNGKNRKSAMDFQENNSEKINEINSFFNNEDIKEKIVTRTLFEGEYFGIPVVDYIYYGNLEKGICASKEKIINYLKSKHVYSASIHVSKLYYQSLHRNLKFELEHEYRRYYIQFKWYSIEEDLKEIIKSKKV